MWAECTGGRVQGKEPFASVLLDLDGVPDLEKMPELEESESDLEEFISPRNDEEDIHQRLGTVLVGSTKPARF